MKCLYMALVLGLMPAAARAQVSPAPIASYELEAYAAGVDQATGAPTQVSPVPLAAVACNLAKDPVVAGPLVNPRFIVWDDPAIAGRECKVDRSAFLLALPLGAGWRISMTALDSAGNKSARGVAPELFTLALTPPVGLTGVGVRP